MKPIIKINEITKKFKNLTAVDNLTININEGENTAILGPNGAGKTTLVEMIEGIQSPNSGEISILNMNWKNNEKELRKIIGLSLQETRFIDKITVYETMLLFASFYGLKKEKAEEMVILSGLNDKKDSLTMNLSGGQKQKLSLGIALINDPKIIILDEPTTGLDPHARREIWYTLKEQKKKNATLLLTTHYMEEAEFLCQRIIIMYQGKIIADGKINDLLKYHGARELIEFSFYGKKEPQFLFDLPDVKDVNIDFEESKIRLYVNNISKILPIVLTAANKAKFKILDLQCRKMNLDDLFLSLTGKSLNE
ncbi:MAG: ABC transporter ATP-binding protein [Spirochaetia bacterium]|nr:ABC transporter ATP-binding protein [Spirochaetia bacterium]